MMAFDLQEIGAVDSGTSDSDEHLIGSRLRHGNLDRQ
jgi:hypothetical protein